jgi:hypothetical protein
VFSSRKTSRKVRAVEVPFWGSKRENSLGAPQLAIHVETLLIDLLKLIKAIFICFGCFFPTSRGAVVIFFVLLVWPGF